MDLALNAAKEELPDIKEVFSKRLTDYMWQEGYSLSDRREYFALTAFIFNYVNSAGNRDNIKVEINYLDRCHILPLENKKVRTMDIVGDLAILTLNTTELYATKINALLSRATPRDLYDVNAMIENKTITDCELLKKCIVWLVFNGGNHKIT